MAKKSVKQAPPSMPPTAVCDKPKPRVSFDLTDLPSGLPDIKKPVRLLVEGKITRLAVPEGDYSGSLASLSIEPTSVTVAKG